ncbi:hypothetical protein SSAG_00586 [Streptomyces sp. Mg1]|nr:hypothetical protein SSAG_00586 [Streptomyces sp. Mg1]
MVPALFPDPVGTTRAVRHPIRPFCGSGRPSPHGRGYSWSF